MHVCVHVCVCHLTAWNVSLNVPVCVCACECLPCPPACCCCCCTSLLTGWKSLKTSLLLWHFSPQHASLAMCDISPGVGVMANSGPDSQETRPWWRQSNNTVTSHNATMLQYSLPSDSSSLYPPPLSLYTAPTFPHASASLSKRD